jgi:PAS domain S-box-containing protein
MLDGIALHEIILDAAGTPVDYRFLSVNPAFERMTGLKAELVVGRTVLEILPGAEQHWIETYGKVALSGEPAFFENHSADLGKHFEVTAFRPAPGQFVCIFQDITTRKQAEAEREKLHAQLVQAQKMESIGRLAGGVAHDFNTMLQNVLGAAELALDRVGADDFVRAELDDIRKAALHSADLTRQLLAFARKQTVAPRVLDLNEKVTDLLKMLRRLLGEDITLVWQPAANLWPVRMDPAQVDAILTNLCVNARDAINGMGRIAIETSNAILDADYCSRHTGCLSGEYVKLEVSDNGCGMDRETMEHVFEPFFATKAPGEGTGLGLASTYGAVVQNGGRIDVASEPDRGTTFHIYLPRHQVRAAESEEPKPQAAARGDETVLLVEDEPAILSTTSRILKRLGYIVLAAATPGEAILLAREHAGPIDLLMTDVVMPEMNGRDLARKLLAIHPDIRRLFMSGYTAEVIAPQGVLEPGVHFIQKPFSRDELAAKLREVLL